MTSNATKQIPLVDYLVLGDDPHLRGQRVHDLRRAVLRPPQRVRVVLRRPSSSDVDVADRGRAAGVHDRRLRRAGHPGAVRRRRRRLRRHERARQRHQHRARPRARAARDEGQAGDLRRSAPTTTAPRPSASASSPSERSRPMADDIWILGIHMTKFGKHPDKDTVDLAAEAAHGRAGRRAASR